MILGAVGVLAIFSAFVGWYTKASYTTQVNQLSFSQEQVVKELPACKYVVVEDNFSLWFKAYYDQNNQGTSTVNVMYSDKNKKNRILLPKDMMENSRFTMHGDTLHVVLGCPKDFTRNIFKEVKAQKTRNSYSMAVIKVGGRFYSCNKENYLLTHPQIRLIIGNKDVENVTNLSIFDTDMSHFRQENMSLWSKNECLVYDCQFGKLDCIYGGFSPKVNVEKSNIGQMYFDISNNMCLVDSDCHVETYYLSRTQKNTNTQNNLPQIVYGHPYCIHWIEEQNTNTKK
jgi:hypothetical protein